MRDNKRELLVGGVSTVKGSVKNSGRVMVSLCDRLEPIFSKSDFLESAPFTSISHVLRFGTQWGEPKIGRINRRHSELETEIEIPMDEIRNVPEDKLKEIFLQATIRTLIAVGDKFNLDSEVWRSFFDRRQDEG